MGRTAKIGLFVLMGLVVALARLVEVEIGKTRTPDAPALALVEKDKRAARSPSLGSSGSSGKEKRAAKQEPKTPSLSVKAEPPRIEAKPSEPQEKEWPKGPVYTVKKGETLGEIAQKVFGSSKQWQKLYDANVSRIPNPKVVKPGTRLIVPKDG